MKLSIAAKLASLDARLKEIDKAGNFEFGKRAQERLDALLKQQREYLPYALLDPNEVASLEALQLRSEPQRERLYPITAPE